MEIISDVDQTKRLPPARNLASLRSAEPAEPIELAPSARQGRMRLKQHVIAGVLVFLLLQIYLGLPGSLAPTRLVSAILVSVIFGAPTGYVVSSRRWGPLGGAMLSSGMFIVAGLLLRLPSLFDGATVSSVVAGSLLWGLFVGSIPGLLIGLHVRVDT